jgi:hypothetical protein
VHNPTALALTFGLVFAGAAAITGIRMLAAGPQSSPNTEEERAAQSADVGRYRKLITAALRQNPGHERAWLDSSIRTRMKDRAFLLAALQNDSITPWLLDTLANSSDLEVALAAVRNPNTRTATLEDVFRKDFYPAIFTQALAAHRRTPPYIFRDLRKREPVNSSFDIWFAGNPATPREILADIALNSENRFVIAVLLENPSLDCWLQAQLARNLMKRQNRDADNPNVQRLTELIPTCTPALALDDGRSLNLR